MRPHKVNLGRWKNRPGRLVMSWRDLNGRRRTREFEDNEEGRDAAEKVRLDLLAQLRAGIAGPDERLTFSQLAEAWRSGMLAGDGAFLMTGLELLTAAHHGIAVAVFVLRDREALCRGLGVSCLKLDRDAETPDALERVAAVTREGRPVVVDVAIDYSRKTYFTAGVIRTNLGRLPWRDRLRFLGRAAGRRILG